MKNRIHLIHIVIFVAVLLAACSPSSSSTPEPAVVAVSTIPANTGSINGTVWHDLCTPAGGETSLPAQPSVGCAPSESGGINVNGIRETNEPGLEGIFVSLAYGTCSANVELLEARTNADGFYSFTNLPAGTYCIRLDSLRPENASLLPGQWTMPTDTANESVSSISITLSNGEQKAGVDFGWDYQFLPIPEETGNPQTLIDGKVKVQGLNLRAGPGLGHRIFRQLDEGASLEILGRSENLEWLLVRIQSGTQGWVYSEFVDTQVVIANLPLREAYGGAYLAPTDLPQNNQEHQAVLVNIENGIATVNINGFPADTKLVLKLERSDGSQAILVGKGATDKNGNARIQFEMPSGWPDGKPLTSGELTLIVSSKNGGTSVRAQIQYYR